MYIGIDIGGTNTRIAVLNPATKQIVRSQAYKVSQDFEPGFAQLVADIHSISEQDEIKGVGICLPGRQDDEGKTTVMTNLPDWQGRPFLALLEQALQIPVRVKHDVATAALGEGVYGVGQNWDHFVYFIWGTGVGGAVCERLGKSIHLTSFEVGHHILDWQGRACACGQHGCAEAYLGGKSLNTYLQRHLGDIPEEDPTWDEIAQRAAQTVLNTVAFHPTQHILFGGGVILRRPFLLEKVKAILSNRQSILPLANLELASLGENSALFGGMALFETELI